MSDENDRSGAGSADPHAGPRVLRALVEELRASEVPPIAWDDMEARLLAKIDGVGAAPSRAAPSRAEESRAEEPAELLVPWDDDPDPGDETTSEPPARRGSLGRDAAASVAPPPPAVGRRGRAARIWGFASVVVAAAAAWALWPRVEPAVAVPEPVDLASVAVEPRLGDAFDLAGLRAGDVVEASEGPVSFGRAGVLRWTLSAGGRVRIVSGVGHEEPRHVVALEQGALDVDVVEAQPSDVGAAPERFVVEVGRARVAVHGTAFRVVRSSRGVVLDVVRGRVAVGPLAAGEGSGQLVEAPARAAFDLDGSAFETLPALAAGGVGKAPVPPRVAPGRGVVARNSDDERYAGMVEERVEPRPVTSPAPPAALPPARAVAGEPASMPHDPAGEAVDARGAQIWTADRVRSEVTACIARSGDPGGDGPRVTIASSVVIDVDAAGSARAVRFDPPIRPDLQACAHPVLRAHFPAGTGRLLVPLEVRLGSTNR